MEVPGSPAPAPDVAQMQRDLYDMVEMIKRMRIEAQEQKAKTEEAEARSAQQEAQLRLLRQEAEQQKLQNKGASEVVNVLKENLQRLGGEGRPGRQVLVDTKGIGKPFAFKNEESKFHEWSGKLVNYYCAILGEAVRPLLEWVSEQETEVTDLEIDADLWEHLDMSVPELSNQLYHLLINFTEGESYDLLVTHQHLRGNGLDGWRRLHRRWDPAVAGRSRKLLRMITNPKQTTMKTCLRGIQAWKMLVTRYERRRDEKGQRRKLPDDIKLSSFETLLPKELEDHILYNKNRLKTYEECEEEIVQILELKLGESIGETGTNDINAFGDPGACFNCGSLDHRQAECPRPKGKGKFGKGKGKGRGGKG